MTGRVKLGYVMIPAALDGIRFEEAPWTPAEMESADETARDVIRRVREEVFWPPSPEPPPFSEPYAAICLDDQFAAAAHRIRGRGGRMNPDTPSFPHTVIRASAGTGETASPSQSVHRLVGGRS